MIARHRSPGLVAVAVAVASAGAGPAPAAAASAHVIGNGTASGCTSAAVVAAVRAGGVIRFDCGPEPVTIAMHQTAKVRNTSARVVIDGGGTVTLSGEGRRRILYLDTCDPAQVYTTSHCQNQATPALTIEHLTLADGNSAGSEFDGGGGGAVFDRGGRLRIVDSSFTGNRCDRVGPDVGGGAVRALSQDDGRPVEVLDSTFSANVCSNGGALSSIGVSWTISGSSFTGNRAIGRGANPARPGTPGGGSGGAIYNDGDTMHLALVHCTLTGNRAREGGGAVFFVSDDRTGTLSITDSTLTDDPNAGFHTAGLPGIFFLGAHPPAITGSTLR